MTDLSTQVQLWRQKAREGTLTQDEMKEALIALRESRQAAGAVSATSREKKAIAKVKKNINSDDLLNELDGL